MFFLYIKLWHLPIIMELICQIDQFQSKYKIPLRQFVTIPLVVPDSACDIDFNRVRQICDFQMAFHHEHQTFCFVGDIHLSLEDNHFYILDGLHRCAAMQKIYMYNPDYTVTVSMLTSSSDFQLEDMLLLIKKSIQTPDYVYKTILDIPKRQMLNQLRFQMINDFYIYISDAKLPRRPNFNIDIFLLKVYTIPFLPHNAFQIMDYIKFINVNKWKDMDPENSKRCINKAVRNNKTAFYITNDVDDVWCKNQEWWDQYTQQFKQEDCASPRHKKHKSLLKTAIKYNLENI